MQRFLFCIFMSSFIGQSFSAMAYEKATEGTDVVKRKLYPKRKKIEFSAPYAGLILNQSYIESFMVGGAINYFLSESTGFGLDFGLAINSDKDERSCIENFYNDPLDKIGKACGGPGDISDPDDKANYGPAYVPIREIQNIIVLNYLWTPVYGKQLIFMSFTSYFDLFFEFGAGLANSLYYDKRETLANGNKARGRFGRNGNQPDGQNIGAETNETDSYGESGRPSPASESHILANITVGQKFHFGGRFHVKVFLRNMTLLGTPSGFENLIALFGGAGIRF